MPKDKIDRWLDEMPEAKIELIDGNLVVGNCAAGNLRLLVDLLEGWGAEAALPMAAPELWRQALRLAFRELDPPNAEKPLEVWQSWAAQVSYAPELKPVGLMIDVKHRGARQQLMMSLFALAHEQGFAHVSGRDVIMRLGDDAFTPDVFVVGPRCPGKLNEHYLDGPADLVIEVLSPGHERRIGSSSANVTGAAAWPSIGWSIRCGAPSSCCDGKPMPIVAIQQTRTESIARSGFPDSASRRINCGKPTPGGAARTHFKSNAPWRPSKRVTRRAASAGAICLSSRGRDLSRARCLLKNSRRGRPKRNSSASTGSRGSAAQEVRGTYWE